MKNSCNKNFILYDGITLQNSQLMIKKISLHRKSSIITLISILSFLIMPVYYAYFSILKNSLLFNGVYGFFFILKPIINVKSYYSISTLILMPSIALSLAYFIYLAVRVIKRIKNQNRLLKAIKTNNFNSYDLASTKYENDVTFLLLLFSLLIFYYVQIYIALLIIIYTAIIPIAISLISEIFRLKAKRIKIDDFRFEIKEFKLNETNAKKLYWHKLLSSFFKLLSSIMFFISLMLFILLPLYSADKLSSYGHLKITNLYYLFSEALFIKTHIMHKFSTHVALVLLIVICIQTAITLLLSILNFLRSLFYMKTKNSKIKQSKLCLSFKTFSLLYLIILIKFFLYNDISSFNVISHAIILFLIIIGEIFRVKSVKIK